MPSKSKPLLYFIILLEGYVVLSLELLAIKITIPFVGSGSDTISIIIAGVLLSLAAGYYRGGAISFENPDNALKKLQINFLISLIIVSLGVGYGLVNPSFTYLIEGLGINNRLVLALIYTAMVLILPVYLLGQTIPLLSYQFKGAELPKITGKILFFSTLGSFLGAVITTIVFMNWIGVPYTACLTIISLSILFCVVQKPTIITATTAAIFLCIGLFLNSPYVQKAYNLVNSNASSFIQVAEHSGNKPLRYIKLNGAFSSSIFTQEEETELPMAYANYIEKHFTLPIRRLGPDAKILVLGAGGFTIGRNNNVSQITYVDIDPDLKDVVEKDFLQKPLGPNKAFVAMPARSFLIQDNTLYDLIVLDIGKGLTGSPEHLVTQEFFEQIKSQIKPNGILVAHYYISPLMDDPYSRNLDTTLNSVFPNISRVLADRYNPWAHEHIRSSVIYVFKNHEDKDRSIYRDDINRSTWDKTRQLVD